MPTSGPPATPTPTAAASSPTTAPTATSTPTPAPTPGGQYLIFSKSDTVEADSYFHVDMWVARPDGSEDHMVTPGVDVAVLSGNRYTLAASWSQDGSTVHHVRWGDTAANYCVPALSDVPAGGGAASPISVSLTNGDVDFRWSPDDSKIAFTHHSDDQCAQEAPEVRWQDIVVMNADGTARTTVASHSMYRVVGWTPDGSALIGAHKDTRTLARIDLATGVPTALVPGVNATDAVLSPDGSKVAYVEPTSHRLHVANADGSGDVNLGAAGATDFSVVWSPDGTKVAVGRTSGATRVVVVTLATATATNVLDGAYPLFWSSDGSRLVCETTGHTYTLVDVATLAATALTFGVPVAWQPLP
jgi:Tol biopolymer transport system component